MDWRGRILACVWVWLPLFGLAQPVAHVKTSDGDTFRARLQGQVLTFRLIGIDAPESNRTRYGHAEPGGAAAKRALDSLLRLGPLRVSYDRGRMDRYRRHLVYVWVRPRVGGERLVNAEMVRLGYARAKSFRPNTSLQAWISQGRTPPPQE